MVRFLRQLFRISLARRFITSIREDGLRVALAKVKSYAKMRWNGWSHSALQPQGMVVERHKYLQGTWAQLARGEAFHVSVPPVMRQRRSIAIIGDLNLPQCRKYRVEQLAAFWEGQGIHCAFSHYEDLPRATRLMSQATHLIEYRLQSTPVTEMLRYEARRLRLPILYDLDDPLFSVSAYETYGNMKALDPWLKTHFLSEAPKYLAMMNGADVLSMSTPELAKHAAEYSPRPVYVRRNFADADTLEAGAEAMKAKEAGDDMFRICFASGSQGHEVDFKTVLPSIESFISGGKNRRLVLLGHFDLSHLPPSLAARTDVVPFTSYDAYLIALAQADCAIMPLADDIFNHCKSAVRVIDAASVGVPSLVGTVGDMQRLIVDGETGHIAQTPDDWAHHLDALAADRTHTAQMGLAARRDLETRWAGAPEAHIIAPELLNWVRG
mmetsp:Transcript_18384/g.29691  ORF Transcript_18384/g.29691 Transcript_18384/m.29691 type:complete len:439 (-) Transcript_18384:2493-3809(-)